MDLSESQSSQAQPNLSCLAPGRDGADLTKVNIADPLLREPKLDDLISSALSKLSLQERSKALEDLHCVGNGLSETDEIKKQSLEAFDLVLKQGHYPIYDQAAEQNRAYVEDASYRLMFLRANSYDVRRSVNQLVSHLQQKANYFGEDKLGRDITLDDLNSEEMEVLLSGVFHIQADRDPTGRVILVNQGSLMAQQPYLTLIRAHYYIMFQVLLPIEAVQLKGLVMIYYDRSGKVGRGFMDNIRAVKAYRISVPVLYSGIHVCFQRERQPWNERFFVAGMNVLSRYARARTRVHSGSDMEVQYSLRGYGIPIESFPFSTDGNIRTDILNAWFFKHLTEEGIRDEGDFETTLGLFHHADQAITTSVENDDMMSSLSLDHENAFIHVPEFGIGAENTSSSVLVPVNRVSIEPLPDDVLFGRGVRVMQHPGNIKFREFLERYQGEYDDAKRSKRRMVAIEVVRVLRCQGVRFLERNGDEDWAESSISEAEEKVGQLFRSRRKVMKKPG